MEVSRESFCQNGGAVSIEVAFDNEEPQYFDLTAPVTLTLSVEYFDNSIFRRNLYAVDRTYKLVGSTPYGVFEILRRFENTDKSEALTERVYYLYGGQEITLETFTAYAGEGIIYRLKENRKSILSIQSPDNIPDIYIYDQNIYYGVLKMECTEGCRDGYTKINSPVTPGGYWCFPSRIIKKNLKELEVFLNGE